MQPLPRRQQEVLQATVRHYVDTTEPVGSSTLVRRFGLQASPATVRSAMGALEQRGLLTQPHTSAGRIPSQQGYRLYVDQLLPPPGAVALQIDRDLVDLGLQWAALDDLIQHLARRLADLTGLLTMITRPQPPQALLQALRLTTSRDRLLVFLVQGPALSTTLNLHLPGGLEAELPILERWVNDQLRQPPGHPGGAPIAWERLPAELRMSGGLLQQAMENHASRRRGSADVVAAGLGGLLAQPEFRRTASLLPLVQLVESRPVEVFGPQVEALFSTTIDLPVHGVWIGSEHPHRALDQCAVVQADYRCANGSRGQVALVGPMRMAYATARVAVQSAAQLLQRLLS